jgi:hypothetical protein
MGQKRYTPEQIIAKLRLVGLLQRGLHLLLGEARGDTLRLLETPHPSGIEAHLQPFTNRPVQERPSCA